MGVQKPATSRRQIIGSGAPAQKWIDRAVAEAARYTIERLEPRRLLSTTYYVSLTGNDVNSGTDPAHPFATIQAALNQATAPGDVVQVAGGTYRGQYNTHFVASGTSGDPITLEAAPGQTVIVDGAQIITGWAQVGASAIYTYTNWNHYFAPQGGGTDDARSQPRDQLFVDGQYLPEVTSLSQLSPGTFYVSPTGTNAISFWLSDSSNPNNHAVQATATDGPLLTTYNGASWCSYVTINGLQFQDCANIAQAGASEVQINGGQDITAQNITVQYAAGCGIGLNTSYSTVEDCHFNHNGEEGIGSVGAVDLSVIDCETAYNNTLPGKQFDVIWEAGATKFGQSNGVIIDGLVSHDNYGDGLWFDYNNTNAIIRNCVISNNYGYGIHYEISYSATIYNNLIFNNHFHYNYQSGVDGYGIFLSSSIDCVVYNNTIVGNDSVGFVSSGLVRGFFFSYANQFFNNIVVSSGPAVLIGDVSPATQTTVPTGTALSYPYSYSDSDYNIFYNAADNPNDAIAGYYTTLAAWQAAGLDTHSQFTNPLFVNQSSNLFQLNPASPALTAGTTTWPGVTIQEANPQICGAHFDTLPAEADSDNMPVAVISDTPTNTGSSTLTYHVTFTEAVKNVSPAAFGLTATGTAAGSITSVSASSGTSFTVNVSSVTGTGTLRLDVLPNIIQDAAGVGKTALAYDAGVAAAVPLATAPVVTSIVPFTTGPTAGNFLQYVVTFNEPVTGLSASNFQVTTTGTVTGAIVPEGGLFSNPVLPGGTTAIEVIVGPTNIAPIVGDSTDTNLYPGQISGEGTLRLNFVDPSGNVVDAAGNAAPGYSAGAVANIDDPAVTLAAPADGGSTTNSQPTFIGAAGTAADDLPTITLNLYSGVGASGTPIQTLTTTANAGAWSVPASAALATGTYTAQATQTDSNYTTGLSTANIFKITAAATGGSISGVQSVPAGSYNLTTLGTSDWVHWGTGGVATGLDRKATGNSQISNVTRLGSGNYGAYFDPSRNVSWTDGNPQTTDAGDDGYIWANNALGAGYSFTVPAGTTSQTLYLYLGGYSSGTTLSATLSDGSATMTPMAFSGNALFTELVAITYKAASANQTLTLSYTKSSNLNGTGGSADLIAAWLGGSATIPTGGSGTTPTGGSIAGTPSTAAASYNLTAVGTSDWAHWGLGGSATAFDHKAAGGSQISNVTQLGSGSDGGYYDSTRDVSWTDGTPQTSDTDDDGYIWANNAIGAGYSFTAPADTTTRTLYVYLGGYSSGSKLTATLSDSSATPYTVTFSGNALFSDLVNITYKAASANQKITINYTKSSNINGTGGSVDLIAAWLGGAPVSTAPAVTTEPASQIVTVGQSVTFTAAVSGSPAPTVQWMIQTVGTIGFQPLSGQTSTTLSLGAAVAAESGNEYEAVFSNGVGSPATTTPATLTVNAAPAGGSLTGTAVTAASSYNLTTLGTLDWAHWGLGGSATAFDHKAAGNSQISNVTQLGSGSYGGYYQPNRDVSWTDGTPQTNESGDDGYLWANNAIGAGYSFTAPADTTTRTLYVYLGGYSSGSTLTATLSDNSASPYTVNFSGNALYSNLVAITYKAASASQKITISYTKSSNINGTGGSADLIAAWLA